MKAIRNFRIQFGNDPQAKAKPVHKYSIYMQSRDTNWLNKNIVGGRARIEEREPIEEDIRDYPLFM